jgi:cytochrome c-type biogenesis protein CcmH/NrfG
MFGDLKTLESDLDLYLRRNRFAYLPVKVAPLDPASVRIRVLPPGEAALIPVKMRSQRGVLSSDMEALARDARERAAPWPNDAGAQTALAEAELYAGNVAAAEAAAERALATAADAGDAMVFKALAIMQRARDADDGGEVLWRDARDWLLRANRLSPDAAMPLMLFYKSFIDQGRTPTTNAVAALKRSVELVPQDGSVRMMLASQYLRDRNPRAARKALMPLAFDPHAEPDSPARRLIERIDQEIAATEQSSAASPR